MKKIRRLAAAVLILCTVLTLAQPTMAALPSESEEIMPMMEYIINASCSLDIENGKLFSSSSAYGSPNEVDRVELVAVLQKKGLLIWSEVETFKATWFNSNYACLERTADFESGKMYRVKLTVTVWSGDNTESTTMYSNTVTAS